MHDRNLARWIVEKAELTRDDYVVEIGPGLGALTEFILESGARVLAIEKDERLAEFLRARFVGRSAWKSFTRMRWISICGRSSRSRE